MQEQGLNVERRMQQQQHTSQSSLNQKHNMQQQLQWRISQTHRSIQQQLVISQRIIHNHQQPSSLCIQVLKRQLFLGHYTWLRQFLRIMMQQPLVTVSMPHLLKHQGWRTQIQIIRARGERRTIFSLTVGIQALVIANYPPTIIKPPGQWWGILPPTPNK